MLSKEQLEKYWLEESQRLSRGSVAQEPPVVLSKEVHQELTDQIQVLQHLRLGRPVEYRDRQRGGEWILLSLLLTDDVRKFRFNFSECEFRIPRREQEVVAWATVTVSGLLHGLFDCKEDAISAVNRVSYPLRIVKMTEKVEVLG